MRHVVQVESNLKCGARGALGPRTLVVGPNGSGKSALVNAVECALSGKASDVAGRREVASDELLRLLVPPGVERGKATVTLDDGEIAEWSIGDGRASRTGVAAAFPLREIYDNLLGTPATAQKWLLRQIGQSALPDEVESLGKRAREAVARAKALREAATTQAAGLKPEPTGAEIARLRSEQVAKSSAPAEQALRDAEAALRRATARLAAAVAARDALPAVNMALVENGEAILKIIRAQFEAHATTKCGLCAQPTTQEALQTRATAVEGRIGAAKQAAAARAEASAAVQSAEYDLGEARADAARAVAAARATEAAIAAQEPAEVTRLREAWAGVRRLQAQAEVAEGDAATLKAKAKTAEENMGRAVSDAVRVFEARVQKYLPLDDVFGISLDPVRFGLRAAAGQIRAALSGAEWARVTAALAAAVAEQDAGFSVVIPEERAFDPATLEIVLRAFSGVPCQVIVTSPVMPSAVPDGWTVVTTGAEKEEPVPEKESPTTDPSLFDDDPIEAIGEVEGKPDPDRVAMPDVGAPPIEPVLDMAADPNTRPAPPAKPAKKPRRPRKDKGQKRGTAAQGDEPGRSVREEDEGIASGAARAEAAVASPHYCPDCEAEIIIGACPHGICAPPAGPVTDPSLFD